MSSAKTLQGSSSSSSDKDHDDFDDGDEEEEEDDDDDDYDDDESLFINENNAYISVQSGFKVPRHVDLHA